MKKREFLKTLFAFVVISASPASILSQVRSKKLSKINNIPVNIIDFEIRTRPVTPARLSDDDKLYIKWDSEIISYLVVEGKICHNVGDELQVTYYKNENLPPAIVTNGNVSEIFHKDGNTHILLTECHGRFIHEGLHNA